MLTSGYVFTRGSLMEKYQEQRRTLEQEQKKLIHLLYNLCIWIKISTFTKVLHYSTILVISKLPKYIHFMVLTLHRSIDNCGLYSQVLMYISIYSLIHTTKSNVAVRILTFLSICLFCPHYFFLLLLILRFSIFVSIL